MRSAATSVEQYIAALPPDRRAAIETIRKVILENLDSGYEEGISYGMIGYFVPHRLYPPGYHADPKQGLPFAALASQKNYISIYLMGLYCGCVEGVSDTSLVRWFHEAWAESGRKLNMGKSCIRVKKLDDVPLNVLGEAIRRVPAQVYIEQYTNELRRQRAR